MAWPRFLILNSTSIIIWLTAHLLLGFFFGQGLWLIRLWSERLGTLALWLAGLMTLFWLAKKIFAVKLQRLGLIVRAVWSAFKLSLAENQEIKSFLAKHRKFFNWLSARFAKADFWGLTATRLSFYLVSSLLGLSLVLNSLSNNGTLESLDLRTEDLISTFKNFLFMKIFVLISALGSWQIIVMLGLTLSGLFLWRGRHKLWLPLWLAMGGTATTSWWLSSLIDRARPQASLYLEKSTSFPSHHAALAIAFFGFLIFFYQKSKRSSKNYIIFGLLLLIGLIGFSRLYLRVNFLSDVLAGYLLGLIWLVVAIGLALYLKYDQAYKACRFGSRLKIALIVIALAEITFYTSFVGYYRSQLNQAQLSPAAPITTSDILHEFKSRNLDQYSENLDGGRRVPLSLIISASSSRELADNLQKIGYHQADKPNFQALLKLFRLSLLNKKYAELPLSPSFWENNVNNLSFSKQDGKERHYAFFWQTDFLTPNGRQIFVGLVGAKRSSRIIIKKTIEPNIDGERESLFEALKAGRLITSSSRHQFVEPQIVKNFFDEFFTDGKLYIIDLR
jgi:undecaprenyl-diphosphatase